MSRFYLNLFRTISNRKGVLSKSKTNLKWMETFVLYEDLLHLRRHIVNFCTLLSLFRIIHVEKGGLQKRDELNVKIRGSGCLTGSLVTICLYNIRIEFLNYISLKKLYRKSYTFDQMFKDKM